MSPFKRIRGASCTDDSGFQNDQSGTSHAFAGCSAHQTYKHTACSDSSNGRAGVSGQQFSKCSASMVLSQHPSAATTRPGAHSCVRIGRDRSHRFFTVEVLTWDWACPLVLFGIDLKS